MLCKSTSLRRPSRLSACKKYCATRHSWRACWFVQQQNCSPRNSNSLQYSSVTPCRFCPSLTSLANVSSYLLQLIPMSHSTALNFSYLTHGILFFNKDLLFHSASSVGQSKPMSSKNVVAQQIPAQFQYITTS